jgi:hypothetical protein
MKHEQTTAHDAGKAEVHQRADMPAQQARLLVAETTRRNTPAMKVRAKTSRAFTNLELASGPRKDLISLYTNV